jgi:hypothetical protein
MPHSTQGDPNPFGLPRHTDTADAERQPARARRLSLPLRMDDGTVRTFDLPSALDHPSKFSVDELERLTRAYAEALGLLQPKP